MGGFMEDALGKGFAVPAPQTRLPQIWHANNTHVSSHACPSALCGMHPRVRQTVRAYDSGVRIRRGRCMHESVHRTGKLGTNLDEGCRGNALHGLREAAVLLVGETEAVGSRYRHCGAAMR
jgi:hypothetical protein